MLKPVSTEKMPRLRVQERQFSKAMRNILLALAVIDREELYEAAGFESIEDYVMDRFECKASRADQLVTGARIVVAIQAIDPEIELPYGEGQTRRLRPLMSKPELMAGAWQEAVRAGGSGAAIDEAVEARVLELEPKKGRPSRALSNALAKAALEAGNVTDVTSLRPQKSKTAEPSVVAPDAHDSEATTTGSPTDEVGVTESSRESTADSHEDPQKDPEAVVAPVIPLRANGGIVTTAPNWSNIDMANVPEVFIQRVVDHATINGPSVNELTTTSLVNELIKRRDVSAAHAALLTPVLPKIAESSTPAIEGIPGPELLAEMLRRTKLSNRWQLGTWLIDNDRSIDLESFADWLTSRLSEASAAGDIQASDLGVQLISDHLRVVAAKDRKKLMLDIGMRLRDVLAAASEE